jgi:hypothetical protein
VTDSSGDATLWLFPNYQYETYTITATPPSGSPFVTFNITNVSVSSDKDIVVVLQFVHDAPVTTADLSPSPDVNGEYPDPTTVTLSATALSGFTVAATYYSVDAGSTQTYSAPFTVSGVGPHTIRYWSVDNSDVFELSNTRTFTIRSNTPPVAMYKNVTVQAGANCTGNASVDDGSFDMDAGDTITLAQTPAGPYSLGETTVTLTVTDSRGDSSSGQAIVTVLDTTAPELTPPDNVVVTLPSNSTATSMAVSFPDPVATDNCATPTVVATPTSGSDFPAGTTTVHVTATDGAGNQKTGSFTVTVLYNFIGFFQPVDNLPTINVAKAGSAIPVKWSFAGYRGMDIFAAGYPASGTIPCESTPDADVIEQTVTAGGSSLNYDAAAGQYIYVWKTEKAWAGTCRQLVIKLNDDTYHRANFKITK